MPFVKNLKSEKKKERRSKFVRINPSPITDVYSQVLCMQHLGVGVGGRGPFQLTRNGISGKEKKKEFGGSYLLNFDYLSFPKVPKSTQKKKKKFCCMSHRKTTSS